MSFTSFNLHSQIAAAIQACGYASPTPIQRQVIPLATISHRLFPVEQQRKTALLKSIIKQTEMTTTLPVPAKPSPLPSVMITG